MERVLRPRHVSPRQSSPLCNQIEGWEDLSVLVPTSLDAALSFEFDEPQSQLSDWLSEGAEDRDEGEDESVFEDSSDTDWADPFDEDVQLPASLQRKSVQVELEGRK